MKTLLLTALFLFFSIGLTFGQTEKNTSSSNSHVQKKSTTEVSKAKSAEIKSDGYMGYKDQIKKRLVVKEIPQNFPTPKTGQTREEYKETMLQWFKMNLDMVKEEYHSNLK